MTADTKYMANILYVDEVEAMVVLEGLRLAAEAGFSPIQFETDSMHIFNLLKHEKENLSETGSIIAYAKSSFAEGLHASYLFTKRDGNTVAHILAWRV